jgi:hypothetical protein
VADLLFIVFCVPFTAADYALTSGKLCRQTLKIFYKLESVQTCNGTSVAVPVVCVCMQGAAIIQMTPCFDFYIGRMKCQFPMICSQNLSRNFFLAYLRAV